MERRKGNPCIPILIMLLIAVGILLAISFIQDQRLYSAQQQQKGCIIIRYDGEEIVVDQNEEVETVTTWLNKMEPSQETGTNLEFQGEYKAEDGRTKKLLVYENGIQYGEQFYEGEKAREQIWKVFKTAIESMERVEQAVMTAKEIRLSALDSCAERKCNTAFF